MPECSSNKTKHDLVAHYVSVVLLFKMGSNLWSNLEQLSMDPATSNAMGNHAKANLKI